MKHTGRRMLSMIAAALTAVMALGFAGCSNNTPPVHANGGESDQQNVGDLTSSSSSSNKDAPKTFSNEKEIEDFSSGFWLCEDNSDDALSYYKICFFYKNLYFGWNISYSYGENLEDRIKTLLCDAEEATGDTLKNAFQFLMQLMQSDEDNTEFVCQKLDDIQYDTNGNITSISEGQIIGTILSDGTLKSDDEIFYKDDLKDLNRAFHNAKLSICMDQYEGLVTYTDVKYDPLSYYGAPFLISGTAELDDYFNYEYRDLEVVYYCIRITPTGGEYSDSWYIYSYRDKNTELFEKLKDGPASVTMICYGFYPDALKNEMANLIDYWY